jgi:hypothetical protein
MLQLTGISETKQETIKFDFYVPLKIEFEAWEEKKEQHYYWQTGKFLEIGINPTSKVISSITLLMVTKVYLNKEPRPFILNNEKKGLPLFNLDKWSEKKHVLSEATDKDFEIYVKENKVSIILTSHEIKSKLVNNRVSFGFDENKFLCSIEIKEIKAAENALLEESLKAKITTY